MWERNRGQGKNVSGGKARRGRAYAQTLGWINSVVRTG